MVLLESECKGKKKYDNDKDISVFFTITGANLIKKMLFGGYYEPPSSGIVNNAHLCAPSLPMSGNRAQTARKKAAVTPLLGISAAHHIDKTFSGSDHDFVSEIDRAVTHARGGGQGGQEGGERGYYHLHRKLNEALLSHGS